MKHLTILLMLTILFAACAVTPATEPPDTAVTNIPGGTMHTNEPFIDPLAPKPGDQNLTRGPVYLNASELLIRESFPPQISLMLRGDLPTPCHELRAAVNPPDAENKIIVDVYSVVDPNVVCAQVLEPFEENLDLGTYPSGHYTVWVNGEMIGEFDT